MRRKHKRIGLALGSGGARGWAHIGVINAIREAGLDVYAVAGTSMGSLVGAAFASGKLEDLHRVALNLDWRQVLAMMVEFSLPRSGLIDGARIVDFVRGHVLPTDIENLPMPFAAVATDIETGEEVVMRTGSVTDAVRASIAIPGLITPLVTSKHVLVDGGLVNPLPVDVARDLGADFIIAVDITRSPLPGRTTHTSSTTGSSNLAKLQNGTRRFFDKLNIPDFDFNARSLPKQLTAGDDTPNVFEIYGNMMRIFQRQITSIRLKLAPPDLLIQPDVQDISTMEFHRAEDAIKAGYEAARKALDTVFR